MSAEKNKIVEWLRRVFLMTDVKECIIESRKTRIELETQLNGEDHWFERARNENGTEM